MNKNNISFVTSRVGNNIFAAMTVDLDKQFENKFHTVGAEEYQAWRYSYLFDALQDLRYGQSFCNAFEISDNILFYERDLDWADDYIQSYYVK